MGLKYDQLEFLHIAPLMCMYHFKAVDVYGLASFKYCILLATLIYGNASHSIICKTAKE